MTKAISVFWDYPCIYWFIIYLFIYYLFKQENTLRKDLENLAACMKHLATTSVSSVMELQNVFLHFKLVITSMHINTHFYVPLQHNLGGAVAI